MDYEAFMNPNGNTGYGERPFGSGMWAALGLGVAHWSIGVEKGKKYNKHEWKERQAVGKHGAAKVSKHGFHASPGKRAARLDRLINSGYLTERRSYLKWMDRGAHGDPYEERWVDKRSRSAAAASHRQAIKGSLGKSLGKITSSYASTRAVLKTLGWAALASDAMWLASAMFTPSPAISTRAQRVENTFMGSQAAFSGGMTQRQRSMQAIHDSQLAISPILGNESQYMHR